MFDHLAAFFSSEDFMPHGHCFLWQPAILWMHVISDAFIALAYYSIPLSLLYFVRQRHDFPFKTLLYLYGSFILLCGTTHILGIWVIWNPDYAIEGVVKALTAIVSITTAIVSWKIIPQALQLRSPAELARVNAALEAAYADVEKRVEERTVELRAANADLETSKAQLQTALAAAEAANVAKSEFLANMSHEIRTPMNAVVGLSNLLENPNNTPQRQKEFIHTIKLSAQSLMDLINDLLDISKMESDKVELEQIPFNLAELSEEIISIMSVRAKEKGVELIVKYDKHLNENYLGDPLRLRQVLMNLVSNAVKFTERGTVSVQVEACVNQRSGLTDVCIDVIDTGIGIPASKLETIFNKFSQADTSLTRKFGGTGLGLSICKTLVTLMGGKISVVSTIGLGSKFHVILPLISTSESMPRKERNPKRGGALVSAGDEHIVVLLVEDFKANILVATATIENCGYQWELAENGGEAMEKFKSHKFDLILMDVQLPVMDGITVTRTIRSIEKQEGRAETPILGITAFSSTGDREKCLDAGMNDFISKPYNPEDLKEKMRHLLS